MEEFRLSHSVLPGILVTTKLFFNALLYFVKKERDLNINSQLEEWQNILLPLPVTILFLISIIHQTAIVIDGLETSVYYRTLSPIAY